MTDEEKRKADPRLHRILDIQRELEIRKALYAEYDAIVLELAREGFVSAAVEGLILELKDNFAPGTNVGWTKAAVKRYEMKVKKERVK